MGILTDFRLSVYEKNLGVYGVHVHQNGKTIAEHRFRSDDRENLYSASKTFVAVAIGIAEFEGLLSVDDYVLSFFPEYEEIASVGSERIQIKHLLTMSSGHVNQDESKWNEMDRAQLFFLTEVKEAPGKRFFYEDLCSYMLGRIIHRLTNEHLLEYLKPRLFDPLKIVNSQWHRCHLGYTSCSGGLYLTTEEFSRLGVLLLNRGRYADKQLLSANFVDRMHTNWMDTSFKLDPESQQGYGYQVWNSTLPNTYRADGMYGQYCVILNDYHAVVTITGHYEAYEKEVLRVIWEDIVPYL